MFRTRQAPSPTGYLHLGTARQMLFSDLFARVEKGVWYLRVDDTDQNRLIPDAVNNMLQALEGIGLAPKEGVSLQGKGKPDDFYGVYQNGKLGPYIQSQRLEIYHKHIDKLIQKKLAYWCFLNEEEREELREIKQSTRRPINYYQANIDKGNEGKMSIEFAERQLMLQKPVLRYKIQRDETLLCTDRLLGETTFDLSLEEDLILLKSDDYPTYHFAHLIDDHDMKTSLVLRAQEWFSSLPKHVLMFKEYWGEDQIPDFIHLPVILAKIGNKKLSKRDGGVSIKDDYLEKGYLPEALINYLAFLGWNPGTEKEVYLDQNDFDTKNQAERLETLLENLASDFELSKVTKTSARFDPDKLDWFNKEYLKMLSLEEYLQLRFGNNIPENPSSFILDKNRAVTTHDIPGESEVITDWKVPEIDLVIWKKNTAEDTIETLTACKEVLALVPQYKEEDTFETKVLFWEENIKAWLAHNGVEKFGAWLSPLRISLSGKKQSPSPFEILALINSQESLRRIDRVIEALQQNK